MKHDDPFAPKPVDAAPTPPAPTLPEPLLVGANPARAMLGGLSRTTLDKLVREGKIPTVRLAGRVLFPVEALRAIARGERGAK